MIVLAWGWAIFYSLAPFIGWTNIIYRGGASQCGPNVQRGTSYGICHTVFNQVLPVIVTTYCYYRILKEVNSHMNRLNVSIVQQKRISVTLFIVYICFLLCGIPFIVYSNLLVSSGSEGLPAVLNPIAYCFIYMNSACNPIVYAIRLPSFRKAFGEIIYGPRKVFGQMYSSIISHNFSHVVNDENVVCTKYNKQMTISTIEKSIFAINTMDIPSIPLSTNKPLTLTWSSSKQHPV